MDKIEKLEKQLQKYQKRYQKLLKADKAASSRYGNEEMNIQLKVLESMITGLEKEIKSLKK